MAYKKYSAIEPKGVDTTSETYGKAYARYANKIFNNNYLYLDPVGGKVLCDINDCAVYLFLVGVMKGSATSTIIIGESSKIEETKSFLEEKTGWKLEEMKR